MARLIALRKRGCPTKPIGLEGEKCISSLTNGIAWEKRLHEVLARLRSQPFANRATVEGNSPRIRWVIRFGMAHRGSHSIMNTSDRMFGGLSRRQSSAEFAVNSSTALLCIGSDAFPASTRDSSADNYRCCAAGIPTDCNDSLEMPLAFGVHRTKHASAPKPPCSSLHMRFPCGIGSNSLRLRSTYPR